MESAKLKWLRRAVKEGLDQIDGGEGFELQTLRELDRHIDQLAKEATGELAAKSKPT